MNDLIRNQAHYTWHDLAGTQEPMCAINAILVRVCMCTCVCKCLLLGVRFGGNQEAYVRHKCDTSMVVVCMCMCVCKVST